LPAACCNKSELNPIFLNGDFNISRSNAEELELYQIITGGGGFIDTYAEIFGDRLCLEDSLDDHCTND